MPPETDTLEDLRSAASDVTLAEPNTYLTFAIGAQIFAVDVHNVREVLDMQAISRLPNAPHDLLGVIDVRDQGIGVIDLANRLGMQLEGSKNQRIVVFELGEASPVTPVGVIADRVLSVAEIPGADIESPPSTLSSWDPRAVRGMARIDGNMVIVLLLSEVFQKSDLDTDSFSFH